MRIVLGAILIAFFASIIALVPIAFGPGADDQSAANWLILVSISLLVGFLVLSAMKAQRR